MITQWAGDYSVFGSATYDAAYDLRLYTGSSTASSLYTWQTNLWERNNRQWATSQINRLNFGALAHAKGARSKNRIELQILRASEVVRSSADV
jgi:hypothetical protein